jgi:hypothetical protein
MIQWMSISVAAVAAKRLAQTAINAFAKARLGYCLRYKH